MPGKRTIWRGFIIAAILALLFIPAKLTIAQTSSGTSPQCSTPPNTINVWLVIFKNEWPAGTDFLMKVPFEDYVYGVIMGELGPRVPNGPYAGNAWSDEVLKAQSVAARTWGSYWCRKWAFNNARGVKNGDADQVYRPNHIGFDAATKQRYIDVSYAMRDIYISYDGLLLQSPYDGKLLDAQYRRDVGNPSVSWTSLGYDYLRSVNNPYTIGFSDGPGWPQTPSHGWMMANDRRASWYQVLVHYYTGVQMMNRAPSFTAKYWNNTGCTGTPTQTSSTNSINYDWGTGSPISGVNPDNFCVEWQGTANFPYNDWYTFFVTSDDGFRLYWDGTLILDKWIDQAPTQYSVSLPVTAGNHTVLLRYYERTGGAVARLSWIRGRGMVGAYYDAIIPKTDPPTQPVFIQRSDPVIQFDWVTYSPLDTREGSRILEDTFSAMWKGHLYIPACRWVNFQSRSDDGVFLKINHAPYGGADETLIDRWNDHPPTSDSYNRWLCPGTYPLEARYYENGGGAVINIGWQ